ncbi:MAG: hypothetical protein J6C51_05490, partial [Clostridia bacterium]|nr:hypothetical protein [Clostridia bacterium]
MNTRMRKRVLSLLLCFMMLMSLVPSSAWAATAEGGTSLETTAKAYTAPVGVTMQRLEGNCVAEFGDKSNLGNDLLFVIKEGGRYYAMQDLSTNGAIPAVDITDWVNPDGSLTVPADTLNAAFWRYEQRPESNYGMFINGRNEYLSYSSGYE